MGWLARLRAKRNKTKTEVAAQHAGGRWENEGGALSPDEADDAGAADATETEDVQDKP